MPDCILLKLITITLVHTQDVESQAAEPTEQSATVLESQTKSMNVSSDVHLFHFWLCVGWDDERIDERMMSVTCLGGLGAVLDVTMTAVTLAKVKAGEGLITRLMRFLESMLFDKESV